MASTEPRWASTASRATRLLWMSERTAIRIRAKGSSRSGSPRAPSPQRGIAREAVRRGAILADENEAVAGQRRRLDGSRFQRSAAERRRGSPGRGQLGRDLATLPGDEHAARLEQRERQLDEVRERPNGARRHG